MQVPKTLSSHHLACAVAAIALLSACGEADKPEAKKDADPAMASAVDDQIMVDPELSDQAGAAAAADGGTVELPPELRSPEAIAKAREEAAKQAGGSLDPAPQPGQGGSTSLVEGAATAAQVAAQSRAAATDCAAKVRYSASWAARLPDALSVYPRGAVQEAAGTDADGCLLSVVHYVTPVTPRDVIDYYYTRVRKAGYGADYRMEGSDHVLGGKSGGKAYVVFARELEGGLTAVELIASGK
jgi:hypothetical protein